MLNWLLVLTVSKSEERLLGRSHIDGFVLLLYV